MTKTLLIISGGIEAADAVIRARDMGLNVVVSDIDPNAPSFAYANDRLIADVYGPEATLAAAERYTREHGPIHGVLCVAADAPVTAALVAEKLKLPGISVESAKLASDKLAMKRRFQACGVPVPWFASVASAEELKAIIAERGSDLVIKPVDSRGSRGVQRLSRTADIDAAFALAQKHSPTARVMVETYLQGPQISTESIVIGGQCFTPGFADRNYELLEVHAPFFIENGGDLPSHLPQSIQDKVKGVVAQGAAALGVTDGTVKGDIVVHGGEPYIIELAARLSGGFFCTLEIPLNTGVDFIGCAIRVALGETVTPAELEPKRQQPVIQRYAFPKPGRVVQVRGAETAKRLAGIAGIVVTAKPGDIIPPAGDKRPSAAMVMATGSTREAALAAAQAALGTIEIETR
ncbi:MAG TPA: ATP-grasp domain-containing protein [Micropepsaceae bacterium]|nr:ATP-grasp domain-containing protein [Micropepsaceae bacterium]